MTPGRKLVAYAAVLAVMVVLGALAGTAVGPIDVGGENTEHEVPR